MKKKLAIALTLSMVAALAGCGSSSSGTTAAAAETTAAAAETTAAAAETTAAATDTTAVAADTTTGDGEIMLAAAASLKNAFEDKLIPMFKEQTGISVTATYDSSGKLQTQIEEGAPVDVFFSAAMKQMNALQDEKMIDADSVVKLLENKLVMIVPAGSTLELKEFSDVLNANTIAIGDPESVPAGQYAKEAFTNLGIWNALQEKTLSLGTNVTEVLEWVAAGSADVGFVYKTDAMSKAGQVDIVAEAPEGSLENPVIYPVGQLTNAANPEGAAAFLEFLQTKEALAVFEEYGFTPNV